MNQSFIIYFFRENELDASTADTTIISTQSNEEYKSNGGFYGQKKSLLGQMPQDEYSSLMSRIENDLVAFGEFQADEIVQNSIC